MAGTGTRIRAFFRVPTGLGIILLALVVGLAGGGGAIVFRFLIGLFQQLFFTRSRSLLPFLGEARVILLPAVGLVLVSLIVRRWAPEAQGHGVPEVQYAVRRLGGRIRARVAAVKAIASAICIGSGGSVGREGPIVQIGSSVGSALARLTGLREDSAGLLVACGAAAGIGGTFNAPIAGVMFAMEVVLGSFTARSFGLVVLASVAATALVQAVLGKEPAFALREVFSLASARELPLYVGLGIVVGGLSVVYVQTFYAMERVFRRRLHGPYTRAVVGGLAVGLIGYLGIRYLGGAHLFGVGYEGIQQVLRLGRGPESPAEMTAVVLLLLAGLKILATSITLAAGGSGGVFAPSLYIGAMAGGVFGLAMNAMFPSMTAPAGAYALVGMGALFGGAAHAPISSILILFEMTDDYQIILPLMLSVVISYLISSRINADSIYTTKLRHLGGLSPVEAPSGSVLDLVRVIDAMTPHTQPVPPEIPVMDLIDRFRHERPRSFPVVDEHRSFLGLVRTTDVQNALIRGGVEGRTAEDIMTAEPIRCFPEETLAEVLQRIGDQEVEQIPVLDPRNPSRLLGILQREQILWAIGEMASEHARLLGGRGWPRAPGDDAVQISLEVDKEDRALCFRRLRQIGLPDHCLVTSLRRADRTMIPNGDTLIEPGDRLTVVTPRGREAHLRAWISRSHTL